MESVRNRIAEEADQFVYTNISMNREKTGYSEFAITTMSRDLDMRFDFATLARTPLSDVQAKRLSAARLFCLQSAETEEVVTYFFTLIERAGHFLALPYGEIAQATNFLLTEYHLERAVNDGFLQVAHYKSVGKDLAEVGGNLKPII